jgi:hypothetical protein
MKWFKPVVLTEKNIMIPFIDDDRYRVFEWHEEETTEDFLKRHCTNYCEGTSNSYGAWTFPTHIKNPGHPNFEVWVYEVTDCQSEEFYLMASYELNDISDFQASILIPHHHLNLLIYFKEYVMPFFDISKEMTDL